MTLLCWSRSVRSCWLALLLSLALHGSVFLLCSLCATPADDGGTGQRLLVETCLLLSDAATEPSAPTLVPASPAQEPPVAPAQLNIKSEILAADHRQTNPQKAAAVSPAVALGGGDLAAPAQSSRATGAGTEDTRQGGSVSFFQIPAQGKALVYVIDRSASMARHGALEAAKRELLASLERLPAAARFQIIVYNRQAEPLHVGGRCDLLPACGENKSAVAALLRAVRSEGSTEHLRALRRALSLQPDVIFFLSDANDLPPTQVRTLTLLNHGRCAIHTIEFGFGSRTQGEGALRTLAQSNGGVYRRIDPREDLGVAAP